MSQLVERWSTNPKVVGSNPTPVEVLGLRLLASVWVILTSEFNSEGGILKFNYFKKQSIKK